MKCYNVSINMNLLTFGLLVFYFSEGGFTQASPKIDDVRLDKPTYPSAGNAVNGQLQVFSEKNDWRIGCAMNTAITRDKRIFPLLLCKALGYDNFTNILFGQRGFGFPSSEGSVEYRSCEGATTLKDCVTETRNYHTCGLKNYIYVFCKDLSPVPLPPSQSNSTEISCIRSQKVLIPRGSTAAVVFRSKDIVASECSTTLTLSEGDFLQLIDSSENANTSSGINGVVNTGEKCVDETHILVTQTVLPDRPSVPPQRICDSGTTNLNISPVATSLNFTYIRKGSDNLMDFRISLIAKAQLAVDCQQLPIISISLLKLRLNSEISGVWKAEIGQPLPAVDAGCKHNQLIGQSEEFFTFNFSSQSCNTKIEDKNNTIVLSNKILISRTTSELGNVIERVDRFQLPVECDMQVDPKGANSPVGIESLDIDNIINSTISRARNDARN